MGITVQGKAEGAAMRTATTSAITSMDAPDGAARRSFAARLGGLAVASLVPAIFWCGVLAIGSRWIGEPLSLSTLALTGAAIACFLAAVCAPLMLRVGSSSRDADDE